MTGLDPNYFSMLWNDVLASPVWNGKCPGQAFRVYMWMVTRTTEEKEVNGITYGLVLGKSPVRYNDIVRDLGCSWRTVQTAVAWLRSKGLIHATRAKAGDEYRYMVVNSRKFPDGRKSGRAAGAQGEGFGDEDARPQAKAPVAKPPIKAPMPRPQAKPLDGGKGAVFDEEEQKSRVIKPREEPFDLGDDDMLSLTLAAR